MKILLLGGNGYIGSKIYAMLSNYYKVVSIDLCLFGADLGYSLKIDYNTITDISEYDVIICLAGHSSVAMSQTNSIRSWHNNVTNFITLCDKLEKHQKLIYASSASVYTSIIGIADESAPINFNSVNNYDMQKVTIDLVASRYIKLGKTIIGLRFGTVNGSSPNTRSELLLNSMVKNALETGIVTAKNLHIRRSILGINDAVGAIHKLLLNDVTPGQYNLSSFDTTVGEMAKKVTQQLGAKLVLHSDDIMSYDYSMSCKKFMNATNYRFVDTVDDIIDDLIEKINTVHFDTRESDRGYANFS